MKETRDQNNRVTSFIFEDIIYKIQYTETQIIRTHILGNKEYTEIKKDNDQYGITETTWDTADYWESSTVKRVGRVF